MSEINKLKMQLEKITDYPNSMKKISDSINGIAFFPGVKGTFDGSDIISNKDIMVLGQDFDSETNFNSSFENGKEDIDKNKTWRNLRSLLQELNISENNCFYTNAIMGIRKGNKSTGKSPAFKGKDFIKQCQDFFLYQINIQKPKTIFVLGKHVAEFLSATANELAEWSRIPNYKWLDSNKPVRMKVEFKNGIKSNIVVLTHPSFRPVNVSRRKYKNYTGDTAEMEMIKLVF